MKYVVLLGLGCLLLSGQLWPMKKKIKIKTAIVPLKLNRSGSSSSFEGVLVREDDVVVKGDTNEFFIIPGKEKIKNAQLGNRKKRLIHKLEVDRHNLDEGALVIEFDKKLKNFSEKCSMLNNDVSFLLDEHANIVDGHQQIYQLGEHCSKLHAQLCCFKILLLCTCTGTLLTLPISIAALIISLLK